MLPWTEAEALGPASQRIMLSRLLIDQAVDCADLEAVRLGVLQGPGRATDRIW